MVISVNTSTVTAFSGLSVLAVVKMRAQTGQPGLRFFCRVPARVHARNHGPQAGEEPGPSVLVQQAEVSGEAGMNQADQGFAKIAAIRDERYFHARTSWRQPEAWGGPAPRENQAGWPFHDDVLSLTELARHDLESEPAAGLRLEVSGDPDPAGQLGGVDEHIECLLFRHRQDELVNYGVAVDHWITCPSGAVSSLCSRAKRAPQNSSSIVLSSASRSARTRYSRRLPADLTLTSPASRSTRKCCDAAGRDSRQPLASSPELHSRSQASVSIWRRPGCASARNAASLSARTMVGHSICRLRQYANSCRRPVRDLAHGEIRRSCRPARM